MRERPQKFLAAFWAPRPAEASIEDTAIEELIDGLLDDLSKVAKGGLKSLFINLEKSLKIMCQCTV
jgi:hypothetical protein